MTWILLATVALGAAYALTFEVSATDAALWAILLAALLLASGGAW